MTKQEFLDRKKRREKYRIKGRFVGGNRISTMITDEAPDLTDEQIKHIVKEIKC